MKETIEPKNSQDMWNLFFTIFFLFLVYLAGYIIYEVRGSLPTRINLFDFFIIVLATLRLSRLFVNDRIMKFFRDWFFDKNEVIATSGEVMISRTMPKDGPKRTLAELLDCPWCTGVWFASLVVFFYFISPVSWYVILLLAVSALSTMIQLLSNMIGWRAEYLKMETIRD